MNERRDLAAAIFEKSNITGTFTLRSGAVSNEYFDKYLFEADPNLLARIAEAMEELVPAETQALAGLEMGGIPLATMLSQRTGHPGLFVRKAAKAYGTCKLAEGGPVEGVRLTIVEDVITSGGQAVISARDLRALGAVVEDVLCVIDREAGGTEALAEEGLTLHPLFTMTELKAATAG